LYYIIVIAYTFAYFIDEILLFILTWSWAVLFCWYCCRWCRADWKGYSYTTF